MPKSARPHAALAVLPTLVFLAAAVLWGCTTDATFEPVPTFALPPTVTPEPPPSTLVERGSITATIRARGQVAARSATALAFPIDGRVNAVYVEAGDQVEAGALIADLVDDDLEQAAANQAFEVEMAQLALDKLKAQRDTDLAAAQIRVSQQAAAYEQTVLDGQIAIGRAQRDRDQGNCEYWCDVLIQQTQASADNATNIAQARLDLARAEYNAMDTGYDFDVTIAEAQLARLQRRALEASRQLSKTLLMAPTAGQIVDLTAEPSEMVQAYEPIGRLANLDKLWITALVLKDDISEITLGQPATIRVDTTDRTYRGRVSEIDTTPALWQGQTAYEVKVIFDEDAAQPAIAPAHLGVGVDVVMVGEVREDVLLVPNAALTTFDEQAYVRVIDADNTVEEIFVQTGVTDGVYTEILDGLTEGQQLRLP